MPFCAECKSLVYPKDGTLTCKKCGWSDSGPAEKKIVQSGTATAKETVVMEEKVESRQMQSIECPKCGHDKAYFHLMQTRKSDEPPTEINECASCKHSWREY